MLLAVEPLIGQRRIWVRPRRRKIEFAEAIRELVEDIYPEAGRIRLVCDNLNTHLNTNNVTAFYERFAPETARRLTQKIEFVYRPTHGSWLNVAEIYLAALVVQHANRRMESEQKLAAEVPPGKAVTTSGAPPQVAVHYGRGSRKPASTLCEVCVKVACSPTMIAVLEAK